MTARDLYLDLLKQVLTDSLYDAVDPAIRQDGRDWPSRGCTMIGLERLQNLQACIEDVLAKGVPGDFIETGVWRGGATIFMRALLKVDGISDRTVWVADSFQGLPPPDVARYPADEGDAHHTQAALAVSLDEVRGNFKKFGVLDDGVRFLQGWFEDTLATTDIRQLSVLRLDGDMYGSTMVALEQLYPVCQLAGTSSWMTTALFQVAARRSRTSAFGTTSPTPCTGLTGPVCSGSAPDSCCSTDHGGVAVKCSTGVHQAFETPESVLRGECSAPFRSEAPGPA